MTAPPGIARTIDHPGGSTITTRAGSHIEAAIRAAHVAILASGVDIGARKVNRIIRGFSGAARESGMSLHAYVVQQCAMTDAQAWALWENPDFAYALHYADPTGETATNRAMRRR